MLGALMAILAAATATLDSAPATPTPETSPAPAAKSKAVRDPNKVICRAQPITGSRFTRDVCLTRQQWDEQNARSEQMMRNFNSRASNSTNGG